MLLACVLRCSRACSMFSVHLIVSNDSVLCSCLCVCDVFLGSHGTYATQRTHKSQTDDVWIWRCTESTSRHSSIGRIDCSGIYYRDGECQRMCVRAFVVLYSPVFRLDKSCNSCERQTRQSGDSRCCFSDTQRPQKARSRETVDSKEERNPRGAKSQQSRH